MKILTLFLISLGFLSCKTTKEIIEEPQNIHNGIDTPENAQILTVILNFNRSENPENDEISLFKSIIAPGYMKKPDYIMNQDDLYQCAFMKGNKEIEKFAFPDPLRKLMEFVDDEGQLQTSLITSDKSAMPLRMNHIEGVNRLRVFRKSGEKYKAIKTFNLEI